ncbi:filamentation induced by cAMP protein fic [Candidatus Magnetobacterium bavaricum]|uniref:Filamentation induced by cAMP protein fic n=1 Tax=Candidatus Magnetobacterium bavaricum TaxID=29290 RepID=A0A0F3GSK0_9BACT|nr:filamentation induced by cAMP protein fic [Candidatus Magnetobacterium bavaricum]
MIGKAPHMTLIETPSRIEPCLLDETSPEILDLVADLSSAAASLGNRLHPQSAANFADLVRVMNCYYSNLIEGHNTMPREIERALGNDFDTARDRRNLQLEAYAHIRLQREIDRLYSVGKLPDPASVEFIRWLHRSFYEDASDEMLVIKTKTHTIRMRPVVFRESAAEDVSVGRHIPPSSDCVAAFMDYFADKYCMDRLGSGSRIIAIAAAHHRLNYIHPFPDGNGRVARLMSHAMALKAGIGAHGLWSISRGLARGIESRSDYMSMMDHADMPRQGDLDGRGNLSRRALADLITWFLKICLDQLTFMVSLFELEKLIGRLRLYVEQRGFRPESLPLLEQVLQRGQLQRGNVGRVSGLRERSARDVLSVLVADGILGSETPKGPVSLRFPIDAVEILFPNLFPKT